MHRLLLGPQLKVSLIGSNILTQVCDFELLDRAMLINSSRTRLFLDEVLALLQPSLWLFGHWHHPWAHQDGRTHFRCVGYHEAFTLELPWKQVGTASLP